MLKVRFEKKEIPAISYGTWLIDDSDLIYQAIKAGYRAIDTAQLYKNEIKTGEAIRKAISDGIIDSREDLFIISKLRVSKFDKWTMKAEDVVNSIRNSRNRIDFDYIDMMLIHWPTYHDIRVVLDGMVLAKDMGIINHIGVSNFDVEQIKEAIEYLNRKYPGETIDCNQIEYNLHYEPKGIIEFCQKNNILVSAYSPFGSRDEYRTEKYAPMRENEDLLKIGAKYGKNPYQVMIKYITSKGNFMIVPGANEVEHLKENINIEDFELDEEDKKILDSYPKNISVVYEKYREINYRV